MKLIKKKAPKQIVCVKLEPEYLDTIHWIAKHSKVTVSEVLRSAIHHFVIKYKNAA